MAYSKIFHGSLPEITDSIIQYFRNDFSTLHSCILVNRLWCRLAIPLLWENPFSIPTKNYDFIKIYLHNLNENDKKNLKEYGIDSDLFPSNTLFNYPSLIKRLDSREIIASIGNWVATVSTSGTLTDEEQLGKHSTEIMLNVLSVGDLRPNFSNSVRLIYGSLFKIFISNEANLHTLESNVAKKIELDYFNDISKLILQNPNFIYKIRNLKLYSPNTITNNLINFLNFIYSNCNSISSLHLQYYDNNTVIDENLSLLINSQHNLKQISFSFLPLSLFNNSLLSLKNFNCSNNLNTIIFDHINFKNITILREVFEQLNGLDSVHMFFCYHVDFDFVQQIVDINKPFKLRSLFTYEVFPIELLRLILLKSGDYLENIGFETQSDELEQQFIEIKDYCKKIKFFNLLGYVSQEIIYSAFDLIKNVKQSLNYISINFHSFYGDYYNYKLIEFSSLVLRNLGQILPRKLEYLSLSLMIKISDFEIFLRNSQNKFIKKLLIKYRMQEERENILPYIKEYIMKKKRVEYLATEETIFKKKKELFSLKDEVKEFKLHNIQVKSYSDLRIDIFKVVDFIEEIY